MTSRALQEVIKFNRANGLDNCFYELLPLQQLYLFVADSVHRETAGVRMPRLLGH